MIAIRQHAFGPPEVLQAEEVDDPQPGHGQVRIRVGAAGVHLVDTLIRAGTAAGPFAATLPMTPGREVAGVVDAAGPGVDPAWVGRRAVAHLGMASGGYAELAVRDVEAVHPVPDQVSDEAAVAMIGTGRTAMGITEVAALTPARAAGSGEPSPARAAGSGEPSPEVVLVTSAAGGLGTLLVQEGKAVGATVVGLVGSGAKAALVRDLGADLVVDVSDPAWADQVRAALGDRAPTVALDGVGGEVGRACLELLGPGGRLVLYGHSSGRPTPLTAEDLLAGGLTATAVLGPRMAQRPGGVRGLEAQALAAAASGRWDPVVTAFGLAQAAEAHRALEGRATTGKVVLVP